MLGGIEIPHSRGLEGHSDADVLIHALMDALLGACGLSDIGTYFPNTDEKYRGISSLDLLGEVARLISAEGWSVVNCDCTLLLERPKIAPHIAAMKEKISQRLQIEVSAIGIKATTPEKLGALGREEGVLASAVALVQRLT